MNRRYFLTTAASSVALAAHAAETTSAAMQHLLLLLSSFVIFHSSLAAQPMNVLFIAADDLRNDLGCYGHPQGSADCLRLARKLGSLVRHATARLLHGRVAMTRGATD